MRKFTLNSICIAATLWLASAAEGTKTVWNDGDVFLGFRATSGTGLTLDYLVDLGQASQFKNNSTFTLSIGNIGLDLASVFGSDWYTRIDDNTGTTAVLWAVAGAQDFDAGTGDPDSTLYSSNPIVTPWQTDSPSSQSITSGLVSSMGFQYGGDNSTANSDVAVIQNALQPNSYADFQPGGSQSNGISFERWQPSNEGSPGQILYFNRGAPQFPAVPYEVLGWFELKSDGTVIFHAPGDPTPTPTPIPTPTPTPTASGSPTPTPSGTPTPTPTGSPTPTPTGSPTPTPPPSTLGNISTRLAVETGDNVLIGGFIVTGTDPKTVIVRAIGPSLPVAGALPDPILDLYDSTGALIVSNDNWMDAPNRQAIIDSTVPPTNNLESAILMELSPGSYTAIVRGANNGTGVALVEAYDLASGANSTLANISTRGFVQGGDNVMIGGFIMLGTNVQNVLIRAIGPSLPVAGSLADPMLELYDKNGVLLVSNDNWKDTQEAEIEATTIPPTNDAESAIVETLNPDAYTAIVRGKNGGTGVALVEIYRLTQ